MCSPTNTAIGLASYPDRGLYFRTIPSDAMEAVALSRLVDETGETTVGVVAPDDDFGSAFSDTLVSDLSAGGLGQRYKRFSMIVDDGVVTTLNIEDSPGKAVQSGAAKILEQLG